MSRISCIPSQKKERKEERKKERSNHDHHDRLVHVHARYDRSLFPDGTCAYITTFLICISRYTSRTLRRRGFLFCALYVDMIFCYTDPPLLDPYQRARASQYSRPLRNFHPLIRNDIPYVRICAVICGGWRDCRALWERRDGKKSSLLPLPPPPLTPPLPYLLPLP